MFKSATWDAYFLVTQRNGYFTGSRCEKVTYCIESNGRLENGKCVCSDRFSGIFCQLRLCHNGDFVWDGVSFYLFIFF